LFSTPDFLNVPFLADIQKVRRIVGTLSLLFASPVSKMDKVELITHQLSISQFSLHLAPTNTGASSCPILACSCVRLKLSSDLGTKAAEALFVFLQHSRVESKALFPMAGYDVQQLPKDTILIRIGFKPSAFLLQKSMEQAAEVMARDLREHPPRPRAGKLLRRRPPKKSKP
jgi:hypothetical protein